MFKLEKKELIYSFVGLGFLLLWFLVIRDLIAPLLLGIFPLFAMLIYSIGLGGGIYLLTGILNGKHKTRVKISIIFFMVTIGLQIISAPYLVSNSGVIATNIDYWNVSSDVAFASLYNLFLPTSWVWFFTYVITPALLIFILPIVIGTSKQIRKAFGEN